jgi:hypothetical protein
MYKDQGLIFSALQASITTSAASTYYIDLHAAGDAYDKELYLVARVGTAFANATSMSVDLQTDSVSTFNSADLKTLVTSGAILEADLTENTIVFTCRIPKGCLRYLRVYYTIVGTHNAGTIDCFLTTDIPTSMPQA